MKKTWNMLFASVVLAITLATVALATAAREADAPVISKLLSAKLDASDLDVQNANLRAALAELQAKLDSVRLSAARQALEEELRLELKPPPDTRFNFKSRAFEPK